MKLKVMISCALDGPQPTGMPVPKGQRLRVAHRCKSCIYIEDQRVDCSRLAHPVQYTSLCRAAQLHVVSQSEAVLWVSVEAVEAGRDAEQKDSRAVHE